MRQGTIFVTSSHANDVSHPTSLPRHLSRRGWRVCACVFEARGAGCRVMLTSLKESQLLWKGKLRHFLDQGQSCVYPHLLIHYLTDRNETYTDG